MIKKKSTHFGVWRKCWIFTESSLSSYNGACGLIEAQFLRPWLSFGVILPSFGWGCVWWTAFATHNSPAPWPDTQCLSEQEGLCILDASFLQAYPRTLVCLSVCACVRTDDCTVLLPPHMNSDSLPYQCQGSAPGSPCCLSLWQAHLWCACSPQAGFGRARDASANTVSKEQTCAILHFEEIKTK